jgi:hypothetical protein
MFTLASTFARTGVIALGILTAFSGVAMTAPLAPIDKPAVARGSSLPIELAGGHGHHHHRRHYNNGNFGVFLGLGLPLYGGYGGYGGYYNGFYPRYYGGGYYPRYGGGYYPRYHGGGYYPRYYNGGYYPRRHYRSGSAHVQWCYNHCRSYREYDNTFQPFDGPRRQCYSPYG